MKHLYQVNTYSIYNDPLFLEIGAADVVGHKDLPAPLEKLSAASELYMVKTHGLPVDDNPAIYLVRDGRDSVVSLAHYIISFEMQRSGLLKGLKPRPSFKKVLERVITNRESHGGWSDNVRAWTYGNERENTSLLKYESLVNSPVDAVQAALDSLRLHLKPLQDDLPNFESLHHKWPNFFRKGKVGAWRDEMSDAMHELFWAHHREAMDFCGYEE
jgi:hypothetical protein